jgi:hypothetical protein
VKLSTGNGTIECKIRQLVFMKVRKNNKKKNPGAMGVKIPGGGTVIYAHATSLEGGRLVSRPLSRAQTRRAAHGPLAGLSKKIKEQWDEEEKVEAPQE